MPYLIIFFLVKGLWNCVASLAIVESFISEHHGSVLFDHDISFVQTINLMNVASSSSEGGGSLYFGELSDWSKDRLILSQQIFGVGIEL